jgi:hypothetical protein
MLLLLLTKWASIDDIFPSFPFLPAHGVTILQNKSLMTSGALGAWNVCTN